jgi:hypothetical protein
MFLTEGQLHKVRSYQRPKDVTCWLKDNGAPYVLSQSGKPEALKAEIEWRLSAQTQAQHEDVNVDQFGNGG